MDETEENIVAFVDALKIFSFVTIYVGFVYFKSQPKAHYERNYF